MSGVDGASLAVNDEGAGAPPLVSVVVIGRNEGERLRLCIESVRGMRRDGFEAELIYADSGSSDGSVALAAELGARVIELRADRPTAAMGRNAGWRAARGSVVLFLDGDTVLHPDFVAESLAEFSASATAVVWGHRRETHPEHSIYNRALDLDWIYPPGETLFCGGDALLRRDALAATGGFDESLIAGEEPELCKRIRGLGYRVLHVDRPMTGHDLAITRFGQYWRRSARAGHAYAELSARFRGTDSPFWLDEARTNQRKAAALGALMVAGAALSLGTRRAVPCAAALGILLLLAARTAWKSRWKTRDRVALLLHGIHSHAQQLPICVGQIEFAMNRRRGKRARLMDYKLP